MPMSQDDIRKHYEQNWKEASTRGQLLYSNPIEDAVLYPIYQQLILDLRINTASILDVGSGSGRWLRFFLERFKPANLWGTDFTQASVDLLQKWADEKNVTGLTLKQADITQENLDLAQRFDLINIANVLFHIPELDRYQRALANLARHLTPEGRIVTTEYLPRNSFRTEWMMVRSRYDFEVLVKAAGLRILEIRAASFFSNDPFGLDGPDSATRSRFMKVREGINVIQSAPWDPKTKTFFATFLAELERACLDFSAERLPPIESPAQKLVVLAR